MSHQRFLVTARKYRPQLFSELVAQEHVCETVKNAIRLDRLAHAYLFTGPRGVGKTSAARILAKAINCTADPADRVDGTEPCRSCESCQSFEEGRNLNIIEIDAASNNSVNDARDLRETVRIPPQGAFRKVYIIDEVHMLSTAAFNALLKTLEEPPAHALFIFATTEPHKVLATIHSRCQRFDFRRIPLQEIVDHLSGICKAESITADEGSLMLLARKGDGALRDALSVFDQAVSLCGTTLQHAALVEALGVVSEDLYFEVTDLIAAADRGGMLHLVERIVHAGYDLQEFLDGIAEHLRNLLVAVTLPDASLIEAAPATRDRYVSSATRFTEPWLLRLLSIVDRTEDLLRASRQPRLRLEMSLLRMATLPDVVDLREALSRLDRLEAGLPAVPAAASQAARSLPSASAPVKPKPKVVTPAPAVAAPAVAAVAAKAVTAPMVPDAPRAPAPAKSPTSALAPASPAPAPASAAPTPAPAPSSAPASAAPAPAPPTPAPAPAQTSSAPAPAATKPAPTHPPKPAQPSQRPSPRPSPRPSEPDPSDDEPLPVVDPAQESLFGPGPAKTPRPFSPALGAPALNLVGRSAPKPSRSDDDGGVALAVAPSPDSGSAPVGWADFLKRASAGKIHLGALLQHAEADVPSEGVIRLLVPDAFHVRVLREEEKWLLRELAHASGSEWSELRFEVVAPAEHGRATSDGPTDPQASLRALCEEYPALQLLMERFGGEIVW